MADENGTETKPPRVRKPPQKPRRSYTGEIAQLAADLAEHKSRTKMVVSMLRKVVESTTDPATSMIVAACIESLEA